jgi:hypothetical protein
MTTLKFPYSSREFDASERLPFGRKHPTEGNRLKFNSMASSRRKSASTFLELALDTLALLHISSAKTFSYDRNKTLMMQASSVIVVK